MPPPGQGERKAPESEDLEPELLEVWLAAPGGPTFRPREGRQLTQATQRGGG